MRTYRYKKTSMKTKIPDLPDHFQNTHLHFFSRGGGGTQRGGQGEKKDIKPTKKTPRNQNTQSKKKIKEKKKPPHKTHKETSKLAVSPVY